MSIKMKKWLTKIKVEGSGLKGIKAILLMMGPITLSTFVFPPLFNKIDVKSSCVDLVPSIFYFRPYWACHDIKLMVSMIFLDFQS